ncbi:uncharacterized protein LOC108334746 isoform X4 [Vigna angularis]|uniref:uncharacterized protein LOC108334746 isoform X4 n=1 Tax=Phaseolus angularis TaxID=3914 RepID=UPI0022B3769B|nr:uncharacterized protein LOC108334746 isoform X4 [Vigna angularis]
MVMFLVLKKDKKMICTTRCLDPPIDLPQELSLTCEISKNKIHSLSEFPQFSLTPVPNNLHEMSEWGNFLNYLCKKDKVALINFEQYQFYILPPALVSTSSSVNVAYNIDNTGSVDTRPRDSESAGSQLEECGGPNTAEGLKFSRAEETCNEYQSRVPLKNFIRADPSYLKTLGQAHSGWIFGAIAELVDNSKDAKATKMDIFVDIIQLKKSRKDVPMLCLIDDGQGMNHDEVMKMVSFGHKQSHKVDTDRIGKFGVGFKTGAMRLGRDVLVLTQTTTSRSLAFLSQSLNEGKDNIEIPIVSYCRQGQLMEIDLSMQSEALAKYNLKAIKDFSPFNKYLIGEKAALFGTGTGTQIYIWNLDEWGSKYCLEWHDGLKGGSSFHQGDILIRSKRTRSRPGQISQKVKSRPLSKFLTQTIVETGDILRRPVELILGFSQLEWERANCGMFLYWHGRLIEAYKRVGGMTHSADVGRGVIGVVDVTNLMDDEDGRVWVHNNKQGFQDSEQYACLEQWLSRKVDEYWDNNFDALELNKDNCVFKPDHEWVQCDKCRKWRILPTDFDSRKLPLEWFCYMKPFKGHCSDSEQKMAPGIVNVSTKRSGYACLLKDSNDKKVEGVGKTSGAGASITITKAFRSEEVLDEKNKQGLKLWEATVLISLYVNTI